ncbi:hypothetical protein ACFFIZ_08115 [Paracoccus rhizosphaerae]|uniref:Uncharacterized protein n=1 Tax=Paracoccus rhizosphaerae TaxID=1133347 RepID=A0ABV6CIT5_9RHOB|nr:hypothetical protein [Paracoccus rhizosphaerae]
MCAKVVASQLRFANCIPFRHLVDRQGTAAIRSRRNWAAATFPAFEADKGELADAVYHHKEMRLQIVFGGLHFRDVDVTNADRKACEALPFWLVSVQFRQAR